MNVIKKIDLVIGGIFLKFTLLTRTMRTVSMVFFLIAASASFCWILALLKVLPW
ncbi:hypothetical protein L1999_16745 [Neobacillus drentensis]|uniref:hypothetical protein n=1 Tax=Neobacillus drentensis TaxID=220684 RepID=UPI001F3E872B|nr:hypothetical protein [Neobacillus drentensis]ULT54790.1 hypothetical protein L1999_16745 [Neobacillus drentensis]